GRPRKAPVGGQCEAGREVPTGDRVGQRPGPSGGGDARCIVRPLGPRRQGGRRGEGDRRGVHGDRDGTGRGGAVVRVGPRDVLGRDVAVGAGGQGAGGRMARAALQLVAGGEGADGTEQGGPAVHADRPGRQGHVGSADDGHLEVEACLLAHGGRGPGRRDGRAGVL